jgi:hypothetical protein
MRWSQTDGPCVQITQSFETLEAWLQTVQRHGWGPDALRFFTSARQRGIPVTNGSGS